MEPQELMAITEALLPKGGRSDERPIFVSRRTKNRVRKAAQSRARPVPPKKP